MEAKQFAELLKSPLLVEQLPAETLRELANRYPFSPGLQMLLLKQYQLNEHPAYDEQLAKAAIYAPDRRALYRLVQLKETERVVEKEPEPYIYESEETPSFVVNSTDIADTLDVLETVTSEPAIEAPEAAEPPQQDVETPLVEQEEQPEEAAPFGLVPPVIPEEHLWVVSGQEEATTETEEEPIAEPEITEPAEETEAEAALNVPETIENEEPAETITEVKTAQEEDTTADLAPQKEQSTEEESTAPTEEVPSEEVPEAFEAAEVPEAVEPAVAATPPQQPLLGKDSFTGWLQRLKRYELGYIESTQATETHSPKPAPAVEDVDEKAALDALFGAGTYEATLIKDATDMPNPPFVEPQAKPTKEELMEPDENANKRMDEQAKKSLTMGEELVTETLAKIYEIQKKYPKAIEAYSILKLRYPEKAELYDKKIQALREI